MPLFAPRARPERDPAAPAPARAPCCMRYLPFIHSNGRRPFQFTLSSLLSVEHVSVFVAHLLKPRARANCRCSRTSTVVLYGWLSLDPFVPRAYRPFIGGAPCCTRRLASVPIRARGRARQEFDPPLRPPLCAPSAAWTMRARGRARCLYCSLSTRPLYAFDSQLPAPFSLPSRLLDIVCRSSTSISVACRACA